MSTVLIRFAVEFIATKWAQSAIVIWIRNEYIWKIIIGYYYSMCSIVEDVDSEFMTCYKKPMIRYVYRECVPAI
jgi:hypothetical protein